MSDRHDDKQHPTPRTNAFVEKCEADDLTIWDALKAVADHARQLERELSASSARKPMPAEDSCDHQQQTLVTLIRWCVEHDGECLGDHPAVLAQARAAGNHSIGVFKDGKLIAADAEVYAPSSKKQTPKVDEWERSYVFTDDFGDKYATAYHDLLAFARRLETLAVSATATNSDKLRTVAGEIESRFPADARQLRDLADALQ